MRKIDTELTGNFGGVSAGSARADQPALGLSGILLVDCDGTLFDVAGQPENDVLFDVLIAARRNGCAVVIHSGEQDKNNDRVKRALSKRGIDHWAWARTDEFGTDRLVWDKLESRKAVQELDVPDNTPLHIIDDDARFAATMAKVYKLCGYDTSFSLPTDIDAVKKFAKIGESAVSTSKYTLEA